MKQVQVIDKLWTCPVCGKKHGLKNEIENKGPFNKKPYIKCSVCDTEFEAVVENGKIEKIRVRKEGTKHVQGFNLGEVLELESLRGVFLADLALEEIAGSTNVFILDKEEKVFFYENMDRKSFVQKTETIYGKNKKSKGFLSAVMGKNNGGQGQNYQPTQEITEVFQKVDSGAFMLTDKRIAFAGSKNTFVIALVDIISLGFDGALDVSIGTSKGQLFLDTDQPVKNEIIDTIKFLRK
jgi:hypothetical protein